ncbi:suppressor protein of bem1/bed5 double mutants-like isoform X1 [Lytechinus variegatus]|uniref:suppressor protein of bem1/bed5 double mutants-like isoform X1 n=2 Tax=Lytechinus variegatus TaxID=7654 RepID=UPI001BB12132|nr:suppressor protein of bem1/bed5 double mutants-like isoform X1 [Lytechinus variegatus]
MSSERSEPDTQEQLHKYVKLKQYQEAVDCLSAAAEECQQTSNVSLDNLIRNCKGCVGLVQQLADKEEDRSRKIALEQLMTSVGHSLGLLQAKKDQLNKGQETCVKDATSTSTDNAADSHKTQRKLIVEDTIIRKGSISFQDVAGLSEAKEILREAIIMPIQYPHLFTGGLKPWKRILLYGPPGTGKSRLAQAVSQEINSTFYCVSSADLISSWVGESEKIIKELFQHATQQQGRSVIFIDELDSICRSRSSSEEEHTRRVKTELLRQMEGADNMASVEQIFLLCATNRPWELDSAFLRRFQKRIYIHLPDREARKVILQLNTASSSAVFSEEDLDTFADKTEGFSGSDLSNLILSALYEPVREVQKATHWKETTDGKFTPCDESDPDSIQQSMREVQPELVQPRQLTIQDFLKALSTSQGTISRAELNKFTEFTQKFGHCG